METKHDVFLSYSRRNFDAMSQVRDILVAMGISVWTDERLEAGTPSWKNSIEGAIQNAACLVVVLSPSAKNSEWVERELDYATVLGKRIFPLLVEGEAVNAIPFELINVQYVDVRPDFQKAVEKLAKAVQSHLERLPQEQGQAWSETQEILVLDDEDLALEPRSKNSWFHNTRRLIRWYFAAPQKLERYKRMGGEIPAMALHSWMLSLLLWLSLALPSIFAFPFPPPREGIDWQMFLSLSALPIAGILMAGLGTASRSAWGIIRMMFARWFVLILGALVVLVYLIASYLLFSRTTSELWQYLSVIVFISVIGFLIFLLVASLIGRLLGLLEKNQVIAMLLLFSLAIAVPNTYFGITLAPYDRFLSFVVTFAGLFCPLLLGLLIHFLVSKVKFSSANVGNAVAMMVTGGGSILASLFVLMPLFSFAFITQGDPSFYDIFFQEFYTPNWAIIQPLLLLAIIPSLGIGIILFGFGSAFTVRRNDALVIALVASLMIFIASIVHAFFMSQILSPSQASLNDNISILVSVLFYIYLIAGTVIGLYIGATTTNVMRGLNVGLDMIVLLLLIFMAAALLLANWSNTASGFRGIIFAITLGLVILHAYVMRDSVPLLLTIIASLIVFAILYAWRFFWSDDRYDMVTIVSEQRTLLFIPIGIIALLILFGGLFAKYIRTDFYWRQVLLSLILGLIASLPILYLANI